MKCPKCGRENANNRKTCKFCGTKLHPYHDPILNRLYLLTAVLLVVFTFLLVSRVIPVPPNPPDPPNGGDTSGGADTVIIEIEEEAASGESSTIGLSTERLSIADITHLPPDEFIQYNGHKLIFAGKCRDISL